MRQICNLIPEQEVSRIARETGVEDKSRSFSPWSHVVSLCHAQLTHCIGLNDLCDSLQLHSGPLSTIRGATPPSRNGLSHANRERSAAMAEQLFWTTLAHLKNQSPGFAAGQRRGPAFRFKMPIHIIDSTTLELVANSMDWAQHRRRKAAAKTHLRLNLQSLLPGFVIVDTAAEHDNCRARELCANLKSGEIVLFDKGYVDFGHLLDLDQRGISWVTRAKDNLAYARVGKMPRSKDNKILRDEIIQLKDARKAAPELMRRIAALVEVDGQERELVFLTNNLHWSPRTVADLYRCRWQIEVFFKQIKQTLQLADFLGHNANAVRWQVWLALLVYVLLRYLSYLTRWAHSFTRLFTILRAVLWNKLDLRSLLERYGTAGGHFRQLNKAFIMRPFLLNGWFLEHFRIISGRKAEGRPAARDGRITRSAASRTPRAQGQAIGFSQRRPLKRPKSPSVEQSTSPCSMASAARCASGIRLGLTACSASSGPRMSACRCVGSGIHAGGQESHSCSSCSTAPMGSGLANIRWLVTMRIKASKLGHGRPTGAV